MMGHLPVPAAGEDTQVVSPGQSLKSVVPWCCPPTQPVPSSTSATCSEAAVIAVEDDAAAAAGGVWSDMHAL